MLCFLNFLKEHLAKLIFVVDASCANLLVLVIKARRKAPSVVGDLCLCHVSDVLVKFQIFSEDIETIKL